MSAKDGVLIIKLKDGIQDTVVFLRMLEQFKIPAVMETRRKKLLEKLLNLQGDTIRETPPSYENGEPAGSSPASPGREKGEQLTRTESNVETRVSEYARIEVKAQQEMAQLSPNKSVSKPPAATAAGEEKTEEATDYLEPAAVVKRKEKAGGDGGAEQERPVSTASAASSEGSKKEEKEETEVAETAATGGAGKEKKKRFGLKALRGMGGKIVKRSKAGRSSVLMTDAKPEETEAAEEEPGEQAGTEELTATAEEPAPAAAEGETKEEGEKGEEEPGDREEEEELEEGVRIQSELEKRIPKRIGKGFNWFKITAKLKETTLILTTGAKEKQLELVGCMVSPSDAAPNGIELFSHKEQKQWVFRLDSSELREKWVEELQKAIDACPTEPISSPAPVVEEPAAAEPEPEPEQQTENTSREVPAINIDETPVEEVETSPNRRAGNAPPSPARGVKTKPVCEIPEQGIQKKGYVHRKKGTFGGWERVYAVVTYAAIYFTSGEDVREYNHVCMLSGSGTVKVEKKGHDKQSEGLFVKSGKNKETLSLPSSEVSSWKQVMEDVLGMSQSLELGSEDEDEGAESATPTPGGAARVEDDLDLYEELPGGEEIDEDIYEEFDEVKPGSTPPEAPPSLPPPRQTEPRVPSPALPPRNERSSIPSAEPVPSLPPRNSPCLPRRNPPAPTATAAKSPAPPPQQQDTGGEELYEDIVAPQTGGADVVEETYEDVVAPTPQGGGGAAEEVEELYEDVVSPPGQTQQRPETPTEDYTEMDMGPAEEYVLMEKPGPGGAEGEEMEVYCEVDSESPAHAPINSLTLPPKGAGKPGSTKITKPPPPASYTPRHAGSLSHKAPKKSKYYEEWCAVEGTNLCTYKSQKDKRAVDKISLSEFDLAYSPAGKDGGFAIRLTKGDKVHHFTPSSKAELNSWVVALRELAKSATLELPSGEPEIYQAMEDHTAESDEQISFKTGAYIRVISRDPSDWWIGQLGSSAELFTGNIGKFPTSKVTLAEDLYI